jgi:hypothetical protein
MPITPLEASLTMLVVVEAVVAAFLLRWDILLRRRAERSAEIQRLAGDEVLKAVALAIRAELRGQDMPDGRMGGDEFCILLPRTAAAQAQICVERIRRRGRRHCSPGGLLHGRRIVARGSVSCCESTAQSEPRP